MSATIITSVVTGGTNNHATTVSEVNAVGTDFFSPGCVGTLGNTSGVAPATGGYAVNAQGTPNMTVAVSGGTAYITATPSGQSSQLLRAYSAAGDSAYTINANASGSTKYDWIYLQVNPTNANNPASDASDVTAIYTSRSSSNTTDNGSPPSYGLLLAIVTVANGASSISNSNILDGRTQAGLSRSAGGWTGVTDAWAYASYSSPTGTITVPSDATTKYSAGMKVKFSNNGSTQYGIITAVSSTVLTVYFGTDYSLTNSAINNIYFSSQKAPLGFPLDPTKWTVTLSDASDRTLVSNAYTGNAWYTDSTNLKITVPIGSWYPHYRVVASIQRNGGTGQSIKTTLSSSTSSESDSEYTAMVQTNQSGLSAPFQVNTYLCNPMPGKPITVASSTPYYLLGSGIATGASGDFIKFLGSTNTMPTKIKLVCAYL